MQVVPTEIIDHLHDEVSEAALLGAILIDVNVYRRVANRLTREMFNSTLHGVIWAAVEELVRQGKTVNPITVAPLVHLEVESAGKFLVELVQACPMTRGAEDFAERVRDLAIRRQLYLEALELQGALVTQQQAPIADLLGRFTKTATAALSTDIGSTKWGMIERVMRYVAEPVEFFSTGFTDLDELLGGGIFTSKLYAIAARKKAGKTTLLGNISTTLNDHGVRHVFVALEMTPLEIEMRNVARDLDLHPNRLLRGRNAHQPVPPEIIADRMASVRNDTFYEGAPGCTMQQLETILWTHAKRNGCRVAIVDYWQLIGGIERGQTMEQHLSAIAQRLANLAKLLGIAIIVAAQLNQEGNSRGGEGIKLAADAYLTLHRVGSDGAYLDLEEARYTPSGTWGDDFHAALLLNPHGPFFEEA